MKVLEAGSGSGSLSLYLSRAGAFWSVMREFVSDEFTAREGNDCGAWSHETLTPNHAFLPSSAVGPKGRVVSFDVREDHSRQAQENYRKW